MQNFIEIGSNKWLSYGHKKYAHIIIMGASTKQGHFWPQLNQIISIFLDGTNFIWLVFIDLQII